MKKVKLLIFICFSVVLLLSLSSCNELDRLKDKRVEIVDKDAYYLEYKGKKYRCLEQVGDNNMDCSTEFTVYIVEEDMPLLLIDSFGGYGSFDSELDVIKWGDLYYCSVSEYDNFKSIMSKPLDRFKFSYYVYDNDKNEGKTKKVVLDKELTQEINKYVLICDEVKHKTTDENWRVVELKRCDETGLFESEYESAYLYKNKLTGEYGIYRHDTSTDTYFISVIPDEQKHLFEWIFEELEIA